MIDRSGDKSTKMCNGSCMFSLFLAPRFENGRFLINIEFSATFCYSEVQAI